MPNPLYGQSSISRPEVIRVKLLAPVPGQEGIVRVQDSSGTVYEVSFSSLQVAKSLTDPSTGAKDVGRRNIAPFLAPREVAILSRLSRASSDEYGRALQDRKKVLCEFLDAPLRRILFDGKPRTFREYIKNTVQRLFSHESVLKDGTMKNMDEVIMPNNLLFQFCSSGLIPCKKFNTTQEAEEAGFDFTSDHELSEIRDEHRKFTSKQVRDLTLKPFQKYPYPGCYSVVFAPDLMGADEEDNVLDNYDALFASNNLFDVFVIDASVFVSYGIKKNDIDFEVFLSSKLCQQLAHLALSPAECETEFEGGKTFYSL